jgi:ribonuclease HI
MRKKKSKYYVVWQGNQPGVYTSWTDCQLQIKAFPGALYKSFKSKEKADLAYQMGHDAFRANEEKATITINKELYKGEILWKSLSVDAAWNSKQKDMEYRGVWTDTGDEIFRQGPFPEGTNNVGEFLAIIHALAYCKKNNLPDMPIYTDSRTALAWLRNKKTKTTLKKTHKNKILFHLIDRAIYWLNNNSYSNKILKWDTKHWGEIPADFGRK